MFRAQATEVYAWFRCAVGRVAMPRAPTNVRWSTDVDIFAFPLRRGRSHVVLFDFAIVLWNTRKTVVFGDSVV